MKIGKILTNDIEKGVLKCLSFDLDGRNILEFINKEEFVLDVKKFVEKWRLKVVRIYILVNKYLSGGNVVFLFEEKKVDEDILEDYFKLRYKYDDEKRVKIDAIVWGKRDYIGSTFLEKWDVVKVEKMVFVMKWKDFVRRKRVLYTNSLLIKGVLK